MFYSYTSEDPSNYSKKRNLLNVGEREYNCSGFALGTFSWYNPFSLNMRRYYDCHSDVKDRLALCTRAILKEFAKDIRLIHSLDDIQKDEYGVAFKMGGNDYHFVRIMAPGLAYHKMGGLSIQRMPIEEVMAPYWIEGNYCSRTVLFAKKKNSYPIVSKEKIIEQADKAC